MPGTSSGEDANDRVRYCDNCGRKLIMAPPEYWEYAGRIQLFCSKRCYDRFTADPARRLIATSATVHRLPVAGTAQKAAGAGSADDLRRAGRAPGR